MSKRWWNLFDGMEQVVFRPVEGGYVYRAPNPWLFGRARYYIANEAQKAELAVRHRRMMRVMFWMIVVGGAVGGPSVAKLDPYHAWVGLAGGALVGLAIGAALNLWLVRMVRPIIAGLAPTSERITKIDSFKRQAAVYSSRFVIGFGVLSFALFSLSTLRGVYEGWDVHAVFGATLFGACTIYWAMLYAAKRRQTVAPMGC